MAGVPRHQWIPFAGGVLVALGLALWFAPTEPAPDTGHDLRLPAGEPTIAQRDGNEVAGTPDPARDQRVPASVPDTEAPPPAGQLRVRLRGLHPDAPWLAPLHLDLEGRDEAGQQWLEHEARQLPTAEGTCTFTLPAWSATASRQKGRLDGKDANYLALAHHWEGALDATAELVLDVQVAAVLEGRVVDARGTPVAAARVSAFAIDGGVPVDRRLAQANTGDHGGYRLKVPPDVPLLVLAAPMESAHISGNRLTGEDGAIVDSGVARADLLPASMQARGTVGQVTRVPDLVAADAAELQGVVRWSDGRPVAKARVWTQPLGGTTFGIAEQAHVQSTTTNGLVPITHAITDAEGRFLLPASPGLQTRLAVDRIEGVELVGDWFSVEAVAPQAVQITIPLPVHVRVLRAGAPVPKARVEIVQLGGGIVVDGTQLPDLASDERGELRVVTSLRNLRLRARAGGQRSAWRDVDTHTARTADLELEHALGELAVEFEGEFRVRNAHFAWTRDDGASGRQSLVRDDTSGPFRLHLEPGRYRLRAGPAGGERNGLYLLPIERDVEVTMVPQSLTLPATFGGRFVVHATDSHGLYVGGTCRVLDGEGIDRTDRFLVRSGDQGANVGNPGELMGGGPNEFSAILPAGEYQLEFDFRDHGASRQRVTIKARGIVDVRIRLP